MRITVAGVGYVGLSLAVLLAQHNEVTAVTTTPAKAELINSRRSPIQDRELEDYLAHKPLRLTATCDREAAYRSAELVVIATPTNYDPKRGYFDTSAVEDVIRRVLSDTAAYGAAVASVPLRDTVKISDGAGFAASTPDRSGIYVIQTPQGFEFPLIISAFRKFYEAGAPAVTDDAMIVERYTDRKVRLTPGDENNIKVTTESDLPLIRRLMEK